MNNQPKILLIDNNKNDYQALMSFLQDNGYNALKTDERNFDEVFLSINPDLIILDNEDNNTFYQKIKQKEVPILCIIEPDSKKALDLELNNVNYIVKPFFYIDLAEHINMLLKIRSLNDEKSAYKRELLKWHRTANIASLSGMIAHNINNYLGVVVGYSDLIKTVINGNEKAQQYIEKIILASQNITSLAQKMLDYSRSLRSEPEKTSIREILNNIIFLYRNSKNLNIDIRIPDDIPQINVDKEQIQLAITNIFLYAQRTTPDGNKIVIKASNGQIPKEYKAKLTHDKYVVISISYIGTSSDQKNAEQLLGLFQIENQAFIEPDLLVARNIIEKNKGTIIVDNNTFEGATFSVYLPAI